MNKAYSYGRSALGVARDAYGLYRGVKSGDWSELYHYMPRDLSSNLKIRLAKKWDNEDEDYMLLNDPRAPLYDDEL